MQEGGELLGQGTYGCIFDPPLLCRGKKYLRGPGDIGKVTKISDAVNELKIAKLLRDRPLSANYFILPEAETCIIDDVEKQPDLDVMGCDPFFRKDQPIPENERMQFKMKYGGITLSSYTNTPNQVTIDNFIHIITHLLEGAALLTLAGVVHYDIFEPNILVDKANVPRFIDWGMAFVGPSIKTGEIGWKTLDRQTDVEPPEVTLATCMNRGYSVEEAVNYLIRGRGMARGKPILNMLKKHMFFSEERQRKQVAAFIEMSDSFRKEDWGALFRTHWSKFDSWSIGCVIYKMYTGLLFSASFEEKVGKKYGDRLDRLLYGMLHLNPFIRVDCLEALEILDPQNKILAKYGKAWLATRREQRAKSGLVLTPASS